MKPLGYYGLNLDISTEIEIDQLYLHELTDLLYDMADSLNDTHYIDNQEAPDIMHTSKPVAKSELSDIEKLGLIRGLCDRIELKLMETAN